MAQIRRQIATLIRRYIAALEGRGIPVERVILFGSHASGHPDEWSDSDIAVISPQFDALSLLERYEQLIGKYLSRLRKLDDVITPKEGFET
jgi:predicted nucleotidyltransferase